MKASTKAPSRKKVSKKTTKKTSKKTSKKAPVPEALLPHVKKGFAFDAQATYRMYELHDEQQAIGAEIASAKLLKTAAAGKVAEAFKGLGEPLEGRKKDKAGNWALLNKRETNQISSNWSDYQRYSNQVSDPHSGGSRVPLL